MNLLLLDSHDFVEKDVARVSGRRLAHIRDVLRAQKGDHLRAGLVGGSLGRARILSLDEELVTLAFEPLHEPPPKPLNLTLLLALPRPKAVRRLLAGLTAMGIKEIYLMNAYRVEKNFWSCDQLSEKSIHEACLKGLEQARDTILPNVYLKRLFKPFVEDEVPELIKGTRALVAHPGSGAPCPRDVEENVTLAVGPEGGFIPFETRLLNEIGFETVELSERVLTVETVLPLLVGRLK